MPDNQFNGLTHTCFGTSFLMMGHKKSIGGIHFILRDISVSRYSLYKSDGSSVLNRNEFFFRALMIIIRGTSGNLISPGNAFAEHNREP